MRTNSSVRTPSLANSRINSDKKRSNQSIGDTLRKANHNLLIRRMIVIAFLALLVIAVVYAATSGYFSVIMDKFYSMMV